MTFLGHSIQRMYKVKQFGSGSEPAGCLSKQQLSNQACFKAATAKKNSPSISFGNKIWRKRQETPSSITILEPYFQICFSGITVIPLKKLRFWTCTIQCVKLFPEWPVALSENLVLLLLHFLFLYFHFISFLITNIFDELDFVYKKMYKPKGTCKYLFLLYLF